MVELRGQAADEDWYNTVYLRVWVLTGNRIWTAASEADPDWVNAEYEQRRV